MVSLISYSVLGQNFQSTILDQNNFNAIINNNGSFFNSNGIAGYKLSQSDISTIYVGSIHIGAMDINNNYRVSGITYGNDSLGSRLFPGPISATNDYQNPTYLDQYGESLWTLDRNEIENHILNYNQLGYVTPPSIANWPANGDLTLGVSEQLAPYIDVNNNGVYEPGLGDYPDIRGDRAVYAIINDFADGDINALGAEIHLMFYQYMNGNYIDNTTFLNVKVFNRSTVDYFQFNQALYVDFDIGNNSDDYIGCDSSNNLAFAYNGDEFDENNGGINGFGTNPPCQGVVSLSHKMKSFGYYNNSQVNSVSLFSDSLMWQFMNSSWADGTPWTYGGIGTDLNNPPTNFIFNGNPYQNTGWNETNAMNGGANQPGDRRGIIVVQEPYLPPGGSLCFDYAFIYDRSGTRLENVQNVINISASLKALYDSQFGFPCESFSVNLKTDIDQNSVNVFPNPSSGKFKIECDDDSQKIIEIITSTGKLVKSIRTYNKAIDIDLSGEPGLYYLNITSLSSRHVSRIVIL